MYTQEQERSASFVFLKIVLLKRFQNGGNGSPNGLRINESEPSDADVADIFALTCTSEVDRIKVELSTETITEFSKYLLDLQQRLDNTS
jgi:hypothetical protein